MKLSRFVMGGALLVSLLPVGCSRRIEWTSAYLEPTGGPCMLDADGNLAGTISVTVVGQEGSASNYLTNESRSFSFTAANDVGPGNLVRLRIQIPVQKEYQIRASFSESGCNHCMMCDDICGSSNSKYQVSHEDHYEKGYQDNGDQSIAFPLAAYPNGCDCNQTSCGSDHRVTDEDGLGGSSSTGGAAGTGGTGTGGETSSGGTTSTGGTTSSGGNDGTGGSTDVDPVCGENMAIVGQYATWCGKVNVHTEGDDWASDANCSSGCNLNTVDYCKSLWPSATAQIEVAPTDDLKTFEDAGCASGYAHKGFNQYACCAPLPE